MMTLFNFDFLVEVFNRNAYAQSVLIMFSGLLNKVSTHKKFYWKYLQSIKIMSVDWLCWRLDNLCNWNCSRWPVLLQKRTFYWLRLWALKAPLWAYSDLSDWLIEIHYFIHSFSQRMNLQFNLFPKTWSKHDWFISRTFQKSSTKFEVLLCVMKNILEFFWREGYCDLLVHVLTGQCTLHKFVIHSVFGFTPTGACVRHAVLVRVHTRLSTILKYHSKQPTVSIVHEKYFFTHEF